MSVNMLRRFVACCPITISFDRSILGDGTKTTDSVMAGRVCFLREEETSIHPSQMQKKNEGSHFRNDCTRHRKVNTLQSLVVLGMRICLWSIKEKIFVKMRTTESRWDVIAFRCI